jgi:hypothetical protein
MPPLVPTGPIIPSGAVDSLRDAGDFAGDVVRSTGEDDEFVITGAPKRLHDTVFEGTIFGNEQPQEYQDATGGDTVDVPGPGIYDFGRDASEATEQTVTETIEFASGNWDFSEQGGGPGGDNLARVIAVVGVVLAVAFALGQLFTFQFGGNE